MPYVSDAQRRYFNANREELEAEGVDVDEWNESSKGKDLPERKEKKRKKKADDADLFPFLPSNRQHDHAINAVKAARDLVAATDIFLSGAGSDSGRSVRTDSKTPHTCNAITPRVYLGKNAAFAPSTAPGEMQAMHSQLAGFMQPNMPMVSPSMWQGPYSQAQQGQQQVAGPISGALGANIGSGHLGGGVQATGFGQAIGTEGVSSMGKAAICSHDQNWLEKLAANPLEAQLHEGQQKQQFRGMSSPGGWLGPGSFLGRHLFGEKRHQQPAPKRFWGQWSPSWPQGNWSREYTPVQAFNKMLENQAANGKYTYRDLAAAQVQGPGLNGKVQHIGDFRQSHPELWQRAMDNIYGMVPQHELRRQLSPPAVGVPQAQESINKWTPEYNKRLSEWEANNYQPPASWQTWKAPADEAWHAENPLEHADYYLSTANANLGKGQRRLKENLEIYKNLYGEDPQWDDYPVDMYENRGAFPRPPRPGGYPKSDTATIEDSIE